MFNWRENIERQERFTYRGSPPKGVPVGNLSSDLVDAVKEAKGIKSDYAVAKRLGLKPQTISNYRKGRTQMSEETAVAIAAMLGRAAAPILIQLAAERARTPEVAKVWKDLAKTLGRTRRG
jgi:transcriptional regulator with XRE-family HTH domain